MHLSKKSEWISLKNSSIETTQKLTSFKILKKLFPEGRMSHKANKILPTKDLNKRSAVLLMISFYMTKSVPANITGEMHHGQINNRSIL